jgi:enoyl-CoA hydratase
MPDYEYLLLEVDSDGLGTITLNRPDRLNALCWPLMGELEQCLKRCEKDASVRVIILKGAGRCFSAGYDFGEADISKLGPGAGPGSGEHEPRGVPEYGHGVWNSRAHVQGHIQYERTIWELWKPVIAQVHGYALAGASTLALVCDLTIMADDAKIGYPPTRWLATGDNVALYSFHVGLKKAKELSFGMLFGGKEAASMGMVNYSFSPDSLEAETRAIALRIAQIDPELLMLNKAMVNRVWEMRGIKTAMEIGGEFDSLSQLAYTARPFKDMLEREGNLAETLRKLNAPWGGI